MNQTIQQINKEFKKGSLYGLLTSDLKLIESDKKVILKDIEDLIKDTKIKLLEKIIEEGESEKFSEPSEKQNWYNTGIENVISPLKSQLKELKKYE